MLKKPGVMIYFDITECMEHMSDEQAGILFRAILEYGQHRTEQILPPPLHIVWPLVRRRLDSDDERYFRTTLKRGYAAYTRWAKAKGKEPVDYDEWLYSPEYRNITEPDDPE